MYEIKEVQGLFGVYYQGKQVEQFTTEEQAILFVDQQTAYQEPSNRIDEFTLDNPKRSK